MWELIGPILGGLVVVLVTNAISYHLGQRSVTADLRKLETIHGRDVEALHARISRHNELDGHPVMMERINRMEREIWSTLKRIERQLGELSNGLAKP